MGLPSILAIITARGGSKGLPGKNIKVLNGKPLLVWSIEAAKYAKSISRVIVSSDADTIIDLAEKSGAESIKRPSTLATDEASSESVILHVLSTLKRKENYTPDFIMLLQPTSPLRTSKDINAVVRLTLKEKAPLCISVTEIEKKFLKMLVLKNGKLNSPIDDRYPYMSRQSLPVAYLPNGAIYMMKTTSFLKQGNFISNKAIPYIMSKEKSIDIDTLEDFVQAENVLKSFHE